MSGWRAVLVGWALAAGSAAWAAPPDGAEWVLKGDYVDACSCDLTCPCLFGGRPTHGYCRGASLIEITEGVYGAVDLDGVTVLAVYDSGQWIKFYVDHATLEQTTTVVELLPVVEAFFSSPVREVKNTPIAVTRTPDTVKIAVVGTLVELAPVRNAAGELIHIVGLPAKGFPGVPYLDHTQYRTVALVHEAEGFDFSGTNGYTARIDASSAQPRQPAQSPVEDVGAVARVSSGPPESAHACGTFAAGLDLARLGAHTAP